MPTFAYRAKKGPAEVLNGEIEADSQDHAVSKLEVMGLAPISVVNKESGACQTAEAAIAGKAKQSKNGIAPSPSFIAMTSVRTQDINTFTRQLVSLIRASVPVLRALSLIAEQTDNKVLINVVSDLERQIKDGKMLSEAMAGYPKIFSNLYLSMVKSGEKGGALDEVLISIAEHQEKEQEIQRKIQAAMAYPLLMIVVGAATVFVMLTFLLPKLTGLFEGMGQALPMPTKILIGISGFMSGNWHWFLMGLFVVIVIFGRVKPGGKKKFLFDIIKLHVPFMRKFIKSAEIVRFARTLGLLLKNGLPIYESMELATDTLDNDALKMSLRIVEREIIDQGSTLSASLKNTNVFPNFAINMIAVGEESGKLEESLAEIVNAYEGEVEQAIKIMTSLLEPLLILAVGAVVGFIVFAMLLPIFNIGLLAR